MSARISSKVVCIRDDFILPECAANHPKKDQVYTVRADVENGIPVFENVIGALFGHYPRGLLLKEVSNAPCECRGGIERGFDQCAFRPVIEDESKSTEHIEHLKKLARDLEIKTPEKVK